MSSEFVTTFLEAWVKTLQQRDQQPRPLRNDGPYQYFVPRPAWLETALSLDTELSPELYDQSSTSDITTTLFMMLIYLAPQDLKRGCSQDVLQAEAEIVSAYLETEMKIRSHFRTRVYAFAMIALSWDTHLAKQCPHLARLAEGVVIRELRFNTQYGYGVIMDRVWSYPDGKDRQTQLASNLYTLLMDGECKCCHDNFRHAQEDHPQQRARQNRCENGHSFGGYCARLVEAEKIVSLSDFLRTAVIGGKKQLFHEDGKSFTFELKGLQEGMLFSLLQQQQDAPTLNYVWLLSGPLQNFADCDAYLRGYVIVDLDAGSVAPVAYYRCIVDDPKVTRSCGFCFVPHELGRFKKGVCRNDECVGQISNRASQGYKSTGAATPRARA
ncbi:hypothetical protein [Anatilimnocola floriformis]|uniref:hypothetical protein n=1 Tax=Anatilimnocola floriformis TaxID=2948575 RepID=UPI0020C4267C|nr:hypothetical protein [Anatilimnocola floriformis]